MLVATLLVSIPTARAIAQVPTDSTPALATTQGSAAATVALKAGDKAPLLVVEKFLKGEPVTAFAPGHVYVLEFWATWCGPGIAAMPHLSKLQAEYRSKNVTFVGINVWEDPNYDDKTEAKVVAFMEKRGKAMEYAVAYDGPGKAADTAWMQAAGRKGIPTTFIVDGSGVIAWIGHPSALGYVLEEVTSGRWDITEGPKRIVAAREALTAACKKYAEGFEAGEAAWAEASKLHPRFADDYTERRYAEMLLAGHDTQAYAIGRAMYVEAKAKKDSVVLMGVVMPMMELPRSPSPEGRALALDVAREVFEIGGESDPADPGRFISMVQIHLMLGNTEEAAKNRARAEELIPADRKPALERWLNELEINAAKKRQGG